MYNSCMKTLSDAVAAAVATLPQAWQERPLMVMLSGGADSTALLLAALAAQGAGGVAAFHAEHGLRGAAGERDAAFVQALCGHLGVTLCAVSLGLDAAAPAVEERARAARYQAAQQAASERGAVLLAAHHAGDQAETVLMRLVRGGGARGLGGMRELTWLQNGTPLLRPFLALPKAALLSALERAGQPHVTDETNLQPCALRNALRLSVMPLLESLAPGAEAAMGRAADCLRADDELLTRMAGELLARADEAPYPALRLEPLLSAPEAILRRALRRYFTPASAPEALSLEATLRLTALLHAPPGASENLPFGITAVRGRTHLHRAGASIAQPMPKLRRGRWEAGLPPPDGLHAVALPEEVADAAVLRPAQSGDIIRPFGHGSDRPLRRALQKPWLDEPFREGIAVLAIGPRVLWVPGACAAEETRLTPQTDVLLTLSAAPPWLNNNAPPIGAGRKEEPSWTNK